MKKFSELPIYAQLGIFLVIPVILAGVSEYLYYPLAAAPSGTLQEMQAANVAALDKLKKQQAENDSIRPFEKRKAAIDAENRQLLARLDDLRNVVPTDKNADTFMKMVRTAGDQTGVELRRFSPLAVANKEFYTELPFEIEIDGNWHSVMQFFDRLGQLPRLANISNIGIGPVGSSVKGVKKKYEYGPTETIAAGCVVTTFFRRADQTGKPGAAAPKK